MGHFDPFHARNHTVLPGVGTVHTQGVANAHTSSLEHRFMAEGAERPVPGRVLFGARVDDDGAVRWEVEAISGPAASKTGWQEPKPTEADQTDYPAEAMAEMRRLSETLEERSPTSWFFDVLGRVDREIRLDDRARDEIVRTIETLDDLLADPSEPRRHFVPKAECGLDRGFFRDATDAERAERRDAWTDSRERARRSLSTRDRETGPRIAMLRSIRAHLRPWADRRAGAARRLPSELVAEGVAAHFAKAAA